MSLIMSDPILRLRLGAGEHLPCNLSWQVDDGVLRLSRWCRHAEPFTLGLWGPSSLSFDEMNLTHRYLAELVGVSGGTVTKILSRLRQEGGLVSDGADALLRPDCCTDMQ